MDETEKYLKILVKQYKELSGASFPIVGISEAKKTVYLSSLKEYWKENNDAIWSDIYVATEEYSKVNKISFDLPDFSNITEQKLDYFWLFTELHVFYRLSRMKHLKTVTLDDIKNIVPNEDVIQQAWFRGQTNSEWSLVPSFFRNATTTKLWGWNDIYADYQTRPSKHSIINKLDGVDMDTAANPYKTTAFIQHSISYSPLVDFTRSSEVALSFALANWSSLVSFYSDNACIFSLDITDEKVLQNESEINNALTESKVQVFSKKANILSILFNPMWRDLMKGTCKSTIHLINKPTNDRMMFQKGTFILYNNVIVHNNQVYSSFHKALLMNSKITQYIIPTKLKESFYKALMIKSPEYHQRYLLNPYLYLGEPTD